MLFLMLWDILVLVEDLFGSLVGAAAQHLTLWLPQNPVVVVVDLVDLMLELVMEEDLEQVHYTVLRELTQECSVDLVVVVMDIMLMGLTEDLALSSLLT